MPDIYSILQNENFNKVVDELCVDTIEGRSPREYLEEYNGERKRRKTSVGWREPKRFEVYSDTLVDANDNPLKLEDKVVDVARIITNFPKKVVRSSVAFMFGGEMFINADEQNEGFEEFKRTWERKLKMHSVIKEFARTVLSETKAAILFYPRLSVDFVGRKSVTLKSRILKQPIQANEESNFFPHFDDNDDMDGFIYKFQVRIEGMTRDRVIIWTREKTITATQSYSSWDLVEVDNPFGLIPVIYADIFRPEWDEGASVMDAREMRLSRTADTNDYFGEPIMKTFGETNLPSKQTSGKEISFPMKYDEDAQKFVHGDAEFMAWQQSIDSVKKELEETRNEMFSGTSTPDLSFESMKGIGNVTGVARRFMTLDAQIKAAENMEIFGPVVQRCISVVIAGIANITNIKFRQQLIDNWITVGFDSILPKDPVEDAQILSLANGGQPFNSKRTVVSNSPLTASGDVDEELKRMEEDAKQALKIESSIGANAFGG